MSYRSEYGPGRRTSGPGESADDDFWAPIEPEKPGRGGGGGFPGRGLGRRVRGGRGDDGDGDSGDYGGYGGYGGYGAGRAGGGGRHGGYRGGHGSGGHGGRGGGRGGDGYGGRGGGGRRRRGGGGGRGGALGPDGTPEKTGWRRYIPSWKMVLAIMGLGSLAVIVLIVVAYAMTPVPSEAQTDATAQGSVVYYADGKTPMMRLGRHRESVPLKKIPEHVQNSVLAAEDRGFYTEPGVSPKGIARAVWTTATGGDVTGGSTITQQMARNYYSGLSQDRTVSRKFKEILISVRLGKEKPKSYILGTYLNTVYFGRQAYGIQAAARAYFGRDVSKLTVSQSAMLAAMIQQPAYFHTQGNDAAAQALRARWNYVLDGLVTMGKLSPAERARQPFPKTKESWSDVKETGQSGYIQQRISEELAKAGVPETQLGSQGLKIQTDLDPKWMKYAEQAVRAQGVGSWPKSIGVGLIAVDPRSGAVKAFYGGNWKRSQYDTVFHPSAQVGSSFKPYVLATALKRGDNVKSMISGKSPQRFGNDGENIPVNSTDGYLVANDEGDPPMGVIDLVRATQMSVNTAYVKLGLNLGLDSVAQTAEEFGIPEGYLKPFKGQAGLSLGIANIPAAYQASGYAAFANGGRPVTPHLITKITNSHGESIGNLPWKKKAEPVLTQEEAAQATYALRSVVNGGTGSRAALPGRQVAGKTGTTEKNKAAWFVGYVPQLSSAVTMFNTKNKPITGIPGYQRSVYGGTIPAEIWKNFMLNVTRTMPPEPFPVPTFAGNKQLWDSPPPATPTPTPGVPSNTPSIPPEGPLPVPSNSPGGPILPFPRPSDGSSSPSPENPRQQPPPGG